jgi:hypothetical protein
VSLLRGPAGFGLLSVRQRRDVPDGRPELGFSAVVAGFSALKGGVGPSARAARIGRRRVSGAADDYSLFKGGSPLNPLVALVYSSELLRVRCRTP